MTARAATLQAAPAAPSAASPFPLRVLPGLLLCLGVTGAALVLERAEAAAFGATWLEALVLAILVGTAVRTAWSPGARWLPGITFGAKTLLEAAVLLLGASISARMIVAAGPGLIAGIAGVVVVAILASYGIGRALGLPHRMALLVACGNSICGNSAIAAVAPSYRCGWRGYRRRHRLHGRAWRAGGAGPALPAGAAAPERGCNTACWRG